jgi:hypothetical protein
MSPIRATVLALAMGPLLSSTLALAVEPATSALPLPSGPSNTGAASEAGAAPEAGAPSPVAATPRTSDPAIAALTKQLSALTEEVAAQRAMLESTGSDQEALAKDAPLRIYGWMDMGVNKAWVGNQNVLSIILPTKALNFAVGNINLYFDFQPSERWTSLVEVRFTNLPDGTVEVISGVPGLRNTAASDYGAPIPWAQTKMGGLILERAYIQYRFNDLMQVRVGQFLTPFGIWNVDHGMPTLIALGLPVFMVQALFPIVQIGVEVVGNTRVGDWDLGYMAYISNGRTQYQVDLTDDKMFGGRVYARTSHPWRLQLGLSGLTGRYSEKQLTVTSFTPTVFAETETTAFREVDLGADLSLDVGPFRLRSELSRGQYVFEEGKRPPDLWGPPGTKAANNVQFDWYLLAAYRLPWLNLEPYLYYERFQWRTSLGDGYMAFSGGLNVYFTPVAQLRLQYIYDIFLQDLWDLKTSPQDNKLFMARIVLGF